MSDYVYKVDWSNLLDQEMEDVDWADVYEDLMHSPFSEWLRMVDQQGAADDGLLPGLGRGDSLRTTDGGLDPDQMPMPYLDVSLQPPTVGLIHSLPMDAVSQEISKPTPSHGHLCDVPGCKSKPFNRRGDLTRHKRSHNPQETHDCPVPDCDRRGMRAFVRRDKLVDHMLAGHDEDTLLPCRDCGASLTTDLMPIHAKWNSENIYLRALQRYRTCPMPRCSFKVNRGTLKGGELDKLQHHLQQKHDAKARKTFAGLLRSRGYDAQSGQILCPVCSDTVCFVNNQGFIDHFMQTHFFGPACIHHEDCSCPKNCSGRGEDNWPCLQKCQHVPDEVRQHRRAILRIWPTFEADPVWEDIECPDKGW